jgi:arsenical resistance protein ArsH
MSKSGAGDLRNVDHDHLRVPTGDKLAATAAHRPRILLLYGSLRPRSYSRFLTMEAARLLEHFGAETKIYDPHGLPLPDDAPDTHTPRCKSFAASPPGPRARCGVRQNGMAP